MRLLANVMDCIFCKIVNKEIPAKIIFEDKDILAFFDIHPLAPVHVLIIPKKHIVSMNDVTETDIKLLGKMIVKAKDIAKELQISEGGYKLLIRTGKDGGQEVAHIHLHLIGGAPLHEEIRPLEVNWK